MNANDFVIEVSNRALDPFDIELFTVFGFVLFSFARHLSGFRDPNIVDHEALMASCDGFLFTGARANVHPSFFGKLIEPAEVNAGNFSLDVLTALVGLAFVACVAGTIGSILSAGTDPPA